MMKRKENKSGFAPSAKGLGGAIPLNFVDFSGGAMAD